MYLDEERHNINDYGFIFIRSIDKKLDFEFYKLFESKATEKEVKFLSTCVDKILKSNDEKLEIYLWNRVMMYIYLLKEDAVLPENISKYVNDLKKICDNLATKYNRSINSISDDSVNINKEFSNDKIIVKPFSKEEADTYQDFFRNNVKEYEEYYRCEYCKNSFVYDNPFNRNLAFAIYNKNNEFVGYVGFRDKNGFRYSVEYFIFPKYRGHNYAYYALELLLSKFRNNEIFVFEETLKEYVFNEINVKPKYLSFCIKPTNIASIKTATRLGATYDGVIKADEVFKNEPIDMNYYTIEV